MIIIEYSFIALVQTIKRNMLRGRKKKKKKKEKDWGKERKNEKKRRFKNSAILNKDE